MADDKEFNFRKLEEKADKALEERDGWKNFSSKLLAKVAGFDPDKKVTQMVVDEFLNQDGLAPDEIGADDFTSFATEAGLQPVATEEEVTSEETTETIETTEEEDIISKMQGRADELEDKTSLKEVETAQEKLIEAHENHDPDAAILAGVEMMRQM